MTATAKTLSHRNARYDAWKIAKMHDQLLAAPCRLRGVPTPNNFRIMTPKLRAAACIEYRFETLANPRKQVRGPPPVSHTCANVRSTRSLR